ncbi:MAG: hypothetical protein ACN6OP_25730 [Pseudomonadales bacterium]
MSRQLKKLAAVVATAICAFGVSAQTLSEVRVEGSYVWGGGFGSGFDFGGVQMGGSPFPGFPEMQVAIEQNNALIDVRCTGAAFNKITSHDDEHSRQMAAEMVFRTLKQPTLWDRAFGAKPYAGGTFSIIYADGGTEEFIVTDPMYSSAMPAGPIPGTLKKGKGVPIGGCGSGTAIG